MRIPTKRQYERLRVWGVCTWLPAGRKGDHGPLIRNGWLEQDPEAQSDDPYTWLRITPDGLRAVAAAIEKHGRPDLSAIQARPEVGATWRRGLGR